MKLLFEKSVPGRRSYYLSDLDVPMASLPENLCRKAPPGLPELAETDVTRHYSALESRTFGINDGFYPLGSCTMKYNPKINDSVAGLPGFAGLHPLQPIEGVQGLLEALDMADRCLSQITGMDKMTFQPAAGAHGEFTGLMLFKAYHESRGDAARKTVVVPDSAHGTNPATASMCGMKVVNLPSTADGRVDLVKLQEVVGPDTAGIMLTNPNTLGLFEQEILEITEIVHKAGGLCYYDGANLNAIAGVMRPGDMGFDCVHLNLHKTFSTPHGGGGPGCGAVGCKSFLQKYLPGPQVQKDGGRFTFDQSDESVGNILGFYGNILIVLRALAYIMAYGKDGLPLIAKHALLNANYLKHRLAERFEITNKGLCMHEFIITMEKEAKASGVTAMDMAKAIIDNGMMTPTMYFPLIVKECLMVEPTETEGKETLDEVADTYIRIYDALMADPQAAKAFPVNTVVGRPDEVAAARNPILRYTSVDS
ncbi:MAG: aminomethyl-transferring glycine dehydrogenase subunit GcvPB [Oscillospiraceae bacterium]|nr:aminomethyl-transferring glycine dehydrogenase subunit GcvPB [Oscillospiraceae bacterium]